MPQRARSGSAPDERGQRQRRLPSVALLLGLLAALSVAAPLGAAIKVGSESGATLAAFGALRCKENRDGFNARGKGTGGWRLEIHVLREAFSGYHRYEIEYGPEHPVFFDATPRGGPSFSNAYEPATDIPRLSLGGAISFPKKRRSVRIGYPIAYVYPGVPPWASLVGQARCR